MSEIFDRKLIGELVKIGNDFENKFVRKGQAAPAQPVEVNEVAVANKLLSNLKARMSREVGADKDPDVFMRDLLGIETFLHYCLANGLTENGKPLAIRAATNAGESAMGAGVEVIQHGQENYGTWPKGATPVYYVHRDGVTEYLKELQTKAKGNTFKVDVVGKLINEFNNDLGLKIAPQGTADAPGATADEEFDTIPSVVDFNVPSEEGTISLKSSDLKDMATIATFIKQLKYKDRSVSGDEAFPLTSNKAGVCKFLSYLQKRVDSIAMEQKKLERYKALVTKANSTFCGVGGGAGSGSGSEQAQTNSQGGGNTVLDYVTSRTSKQKPIGSDELDLNSIKSFCAAVSEVFTKEEWQNAIATQYNIDISAPDGKQRLAGIVQGMLASVQACETINENLMNNFVQAPWILPYSDIIIQTQGGTAVDQSYRNFGNWLNSGKNTGHAVAAVTADLQKLLTQCARVYGSVAAHNKTAYQEQNQAAQKWNARLADISRSATAAKSQGH